MHIGYRLQNKAMTVANKIMNLFKKDDPSSIRRCRKLAEEVFGEGWEEKGAGIYDEGPEKANIWGIGQYVVSMVYVSMTHMFGVAVT